MVRSNIPRLLKKIERPHDRVVLHCGRHDVVSGLHQSKDCEIEGFRPVLGEYHPLRVFAVEEKGKLLPCLENQASRVNGEGMSPSARVSAHGRQEILDAVDRLFRLRKRGGCVIEIEHQGFRTLVESARELIISYMLLTLPTLTFSLR